LRASSSVPNTLRRVRPARPSGPQRRRAGRKWFWGAPAAPRAGRRPARRGGGAREPARGARAAIAAARIAGRMACFWLKGGARRARGRVTLASQYGDTFPSHALLPSLLQGAALRYNLLACALDKGNNQLDERY